MTFATDDLASVLIAPDREFAGYGQALLRQFDNESFDNTVEYRGALLHNLPVLDRVGGLSYKAGDVVLLMKWRPTGGGLASFWIAGSPVVPGAGRAEEAVAFLRGQLAKQISAEVFAGRVHSDSVEGQEQTTSTSYTDLTTVGPTVADVEISAAGLAIVFTNAGIHGGGSSTKTSQGGDMSFEVSGATSVAPTANDPRSVRLTVATGTFGDIGTPSVVDRSCSMTVVPLNPGIHTFQAKYRASGTNSPTGQFNQRSLVVVGL